MQLFVHKNKTRNGFTSNSIFSTLILYTLLMLNFIIKADTQFTPMYVRSSESLTEVPSSDISSTTRTIKLLHNNITSLIAQQFSNQQQLAVLNLKDNLISSIHPTAFQNTQIQMLDLSENRLTELPYFGYIGDSLITMNISFNQLTSVPKGSMEDLSELLLLYMGGNVNLDWNNITGLDDVLDTVRSLDLLSTNASDLLEPIQIPENASSLRELFFKNCQFKFFPFNTSQVLDLLLLDMGDNELSEEDVANADGLNFITVSGLFQLARNKFRNFPDFDANLRSALRELRLSRNEIVEIDQNLLTGYHSLEKLKLNHNHLLHLPNFPPMPLENLELHSNYITSLNLETFVNLTNLQELILESNLIQTVEGSSSIPFSSHVLLLVLYENPLSCDCAFTYLLNASQFYREYSTEIIVYLDEYPCAIPAQLVPLAATEITVPHLCDNASFSYTTQILDTSTFSTSSTSTTTKPPTTSSDSTIAPTNSTGAPTYSTGAPTNSTGAPTNSTGAPTVQTGSQTGMETSSYSSRSSRDNTVVGVELVTLTHVEIAVDLTTLIPVSTEESVSTVSTDFGDYTSVADSNEFHCDKFHTWKNIRTNNTIFELGGNITYWCKLGFSWSDALVERVAVCSVSSGMWDPDLLPCTAEASSTSQGSYNQAVEASEAEVIGSFFIMAVMATLGFIIFLDLSHAPKLFRAIKRMWRRFWSAKRRTERTSARSDRVVAWQC